MSKEFKISVIVPVFNASDHLEKCIKSILNQKYQNIELILINDGSTDDSERIINKYLQKDKRIIYRKKENSGVSDTRNIGLSLSSGDYITFVDADDEVKPNIYFKMIEKLTNSDCEICFCSFYEVFSDREKIVAFPWEDNKVFSHKEILDVFIPRIIGVHGNEKETVFGAVWRAMYKKEVLKNIKFNRNIRVAEDVLFNIDCLINSKSIITTNEPMYCYNQYIGSTLKSYKKDSYERSKIYHDNLVKKLNYINFFNNKINCERYSLNKFHHYLYGLTNLPRSKENKMNYILSEIRIMEHDFENDEFINDNIIKNLEFPKRMLYYLLKYKMTFLILIFIKVNHMIRW